MSSLLFWVFAVIMLVFGVLVVVHRNPVASALSLVVCFLALAALFVTLDAYFIGIIQVLVYAGAVMVLFLFIIMLLDLKAELRRKLNPVTFFGGGLVAVAFAFQIWSVIQVLPGGNRPLPRMDMAAFDDVRSVGMILFTSYNLPLQIIGVLVLVATVGVIILSKRELK